VEALDHVLNSGLLLSLPSERSEHWRRLRDWSFCPSFRVCVHGD